jgi:hypothetical protein
MFEILKPGVDFSYWYAAKLVADIPDDKMAGQPIPGITLNHAAWTLSHLAWANDNILSYLGQTSKFDSLEKIAAMDTTPTSDRSQYPPKAELLKMLKDADTRLWAAVTSASADQLNTPTSENMRKMFPTLGSLVIGLLTGHYSAHLGQLSAWRRAMGFPSVF